MQQGSCHTLDGRANNRMAHTRIHSIHTKREYLCGKAANIHLNCLILIDLLMTGHLFVMACSIHSGMPGTILALPAVLNNNHSAVERNGRRLRIRVANS